MNQSGDLPDDYKYITCNSKRDHLWKDCYFYIVIINACARVRSHISHIKSNKLPLINLIMNIQRPLCHLLPKQIAKIFTRAGTGVVLPSNGAARINKKQKFLVVTLRKSRSHSYSQCLSKKVEVANIKKYSIKNGFGNGNMYAWPIFRSDIKHYLDYWESVFFFILF